MDFAIRIFNFKINKTHAYFEHEHRVRSLFLLIVALALVLHIECVNEVEWVECTLHNRKMYGNEMQLPGSMVFDCVFKGGMQRQAPYYRVDRACMPHALARAFRCGEMVLALSLIDVKHSLPKAYHAQAQLKGQPKAKNFITFRFHLDEHKHSCETTMIRQCEWHFSSPLFFHFLLWLGEIAMPFLWLCCIRTIYYWCW